MNEKDYFSTMLVDTSMLNENRDISIPGLLRFMENALEEHLLDIGMDIPVILPKYGVFWVFLAITAETRSPVRAGERLTARTWNGGRNGLLFRRELSVTHADGTPAVEAECYSALVDSRTRHIVKDPAILSNFDMPAGERLVMAESRMQPELELFREADRRYVYPSWVDGLGHVNNSRYGDMMTDILLLGEKPPEGSLRRLELYFVGELHRGETVTLLRRDPEPGKTEFAGLHPDGGHAFYARTFYA